MIADAIAERERLGQPALAAGSPFPHGKLDSLTGLRRWSRGWAAPIDYKALDGAPVDLVVPAVVAA